MKAPIALVAPYLRKNRNGFQYPNLGSWTRTLYDFNTYRSRVAMRRVAVDTNERLNLRISREIKAKLVRAAELRQTDVTSFVTEASLREAETVIREADVIKVCERDYRRILELPEDPPPPNARLIAAAKVRPDSI